MSTADIDAAHLKWLDAMRANDAAALGRLVTDDVVLMPPHVQPVSGTRGVIDWFGGLVTEARTTGIAVTQREVTLAGDLAVERGAFTWTVAPARGGAEIEERGSFLAIWHRQPDGSWKLARNIWNSTLPLPTVVGPSTGRD
jgi:ketosteroid isomerase-like protein